MNSKLNQLASGLLGCIISLTGTTELATGWIDSVEKITSIVCSAIGLLITIIGVVIIPVIAKIRDAKKDGVVTEEEKDAILKTLDDGIKKVSAKTNSTTGKEDK